MLIDYKLLGDKELLAMKFFLQQWFPVEADGTLIEELK